MHWTKYALYQIQIYIQCVSETGFLLFSDREILSTKALKTLVAGVRLQLQLYLEGAKRRECEQYTSVQDL